MTDTEKKQSEGYPKCETRPVSCIDGMRGSRGEYISPPSVKEKTEKPSLLLHACCGPCSTAVVERLAGEFNITIFFYNPCITDEAEYRKRKEALLKFIRAFNEERMSEVRPEDRGELRFIEGPYSPGAFFRIARGYEDEPEGGARCRLCFGQRLEKTAEEAAVTGCDYFATTLTVSPHKSFRVISEIGRQLAVKYGLTFLDRDFKKKGGFKRSIELSAKYGLYRQNYCGCEYSRR